MQDDTTLKYTAACVVPLDQLERAATNGAVVLNIFVTRSLGEERFDIDVLVPTSAD